MNRILGVRLKNKRKELGLTQSELAAGICEQSQISRIEQTNFAPSSDILYMLSKKLGVTMEYFFDETIQENFSNLAHFKTLIDTAFTRRDYKTIGYLLQMEKGRDILLSTEDSLYLEWLQAIVLYKLNDELDHAITKLENLLPKVQYYYFYYLDFLNSLSICYDETDRQEDYFKIHSLMMEAIDNINLSDSIQFKKMIKMRYNYARFLIKMANIREAVKEILELIALLKESDSSYLLADLYCLLASSGEVFLAKDEVLNYNKKAAVLYNIYGNDLMYHSLKQYLSQFSLEDEI
ncbi:helix-turn-helix domain-containing protein [Streptococcus marmotae]|uniref:helix-turn-helix domain-containing protein n=1 Tax=Streptococcus marmotae TaxID=1825069 RepID=UPI00083494CA|nr:helix-turn-helix transcriptional regulator [Streptococcus marmotae]